MTFNSIFELLTVASDISEFISLKKAYDNHDQLQIIKRLDNMDDELFNQLLKNQQTIINLLGVLIMDKKILDTITHTQDKHKMDELGDMFINLVNDLKEADKTKYEMISYKLHKLAYGDHLSEEQAHCWVDNMQNKDGTTGEHWSYEQTESVRASYGIDANACDFYAVMNMVYSDDYEPQFALEDYVKLAKNFIMDKDAPEDKVLRYYSYIVK